MKTPMMATLIAGLLLASATAAVFTVGLPALKDADVNDAGADEAALHGGMAGDDPHAQLGMERPRFPPATGNVPTADQAKNLQELSLVEIRNDTEFNPANGVKSGTGTLEDPYVISGYYVTGDLYIADTDACFLITGNYIDRQLALNWNGQCVWVHHNFIRDLRVNENIERTGMDTGGLIEANLINYVGQIRHYDGEFRNNVIGPREDAKLPFGVFDDPENVLPFVKDTRILNIDGWNEALFHHNTVYGSTDLKLHGHHHSTGFLAQHSHYHGDGTPPAHTEDHTDRWSSVSFTDNKLVDPTGYGLRYTDEAHAGDDQTANSESNMDLEKDHKHHTQVEILRNELEGAGILVDIFNADDDLHYVRNPGWFAISDNSVKLKERSDDILGDFVFFGPRFDANTGIKVYATKEVEFTIERNTLTFEKSSGSSDPLAPLHQFTDPMFGQNRDPVAISLEGVRDANVTVASNKATGFVYGVKGYDMDEKANWAVYDNQDDSQNSVYYDNTVANKPQDHAFANEQAPAEPNPDHEGHEHG